MVPNHRPHPGGGPVTAGWRECADPDELAAAVAAGVEVQISYRVPTSWTWHQEPPAPDGVVAPEPPAPDEVAAPDDDWCEAVLNDLNSIIHGHCGSDGSDDAHCDWVNDLANEVVRYFQRQDVLAVLPTPPAPPWPGAVLSGLTDEDGVPTWLAQAGQVRGEPVRPCVSTRWDGRDWAQDDAWVEVRAPRAVPEPETERVPWWEVVADQRRLVGFPEVGGTRYGADGCLAFTDHDGVLLANVHDPAIGWDGSGTVEVLSEDP